MLSGVAEKALYRAYSSSLRKSDNEVSHIDCSAFESLLELSDNVHSDTKVWLAIDGDTVVGYIVTEEVCETDGSLSLLISDISFHINNNTVANGLLVKAIDWARSKNMSNIDITVRTREIGKKSLLTNNGFKRRIGYYNTRCVYTHKLK